MGRSILPKNILEPFCMLHVYICGIFSGFLERDRCLGKITLDLNLASFHFLKHLLTCFTAPYFLRDFERDSENVGSSNIRDLLLYF